MKKDEVIEQATEDGNSIIQIGELMICGSEPAEDLANLAMRILSYELVMEYLNLRKNQKKAVGYCG